MKKLTSHEIRQKFIDFQKRKGHVEIAAVGLLPENDSTLLFVNSGMFPLVPYLLGQKHPAGTRLANYQRSFRTDDIEEVGDHRHTTFFEMLGNWSLADYFKKEQLDNWYEFLIQELGFDANKIYQTVFAGDDRASMDDETIEILKNIYKKYGVTAGVGKATTGKGDYGTGEEVDFTIDRIFPYRDKNWWQRGEAIGEVGGPDTETFYDTGRQHDTKFGPHCHVNCDCGRFIEIGNSVFIQYILTANGWEQIKNKNVDFGGGLERLTMVANGLNNVFETDCFKEYISIIEKATGIMYTDHQKEFEIISDHIRAAVFLIMDGALPSNKDQGYFVRRLLRRVLVAMHKLGIDFDFIDKLAEKVIDYMGDVYTKLPVQKQNILSIIKKEKENFAQTLTKGMKYFDEIINKTGKISADDAFILQSTYGFPFEIILEIATERGINIDKDEYNKKVAEHREISKAGADKKFKSGLADSSELTTKYHTIAHITLAVMREILGDHVVQKGSNITSERIRFDFSHPEKLTDEQIKKIEDKVNKIISDCFHVEKQDMPLAEAKKAGAMGVFDDRYTENVSVYTVIATDGHVVSKEICAGPHINDSEGIGTFKIMKEESAGAGIRRIKAQLLEK